MLRANKGRPISVKFKDTDFLNIVCTFDIFFVSETFQRNLNYEKEGFIINIHKKQG